jgi:hypothetical protein
LLTPKATVPHISERLGPAFIDSGAAWQSPFDFAPATAGKQGRIIGGYRTGTNASQLS